MATFAFNKFQAFVEALAHGDHNLATTGDSLKLALTSEAPLATNAVLDDLTVISYANIDDDMALTINSSAQTGGEFVLKITNKILNATGTVAAFRYIVIYNDTPAAATDKGLICWYDYLNSVVMNNGDTFTIEFDQTNGVLSIE